MAIHRADLIRRTPKIAVEFFALFSRMEYALVESGYVYGTVGKRAAADWKSFGKDLPPAFFPQLQADQRVEIYLKTPPMMLVFQGDGKVHFVDGAAVTDAPSLLASIGRARNNLFHGSKTWMKKRDVDLLQVGFIVLDFALDSAINGAGNCPKVVQHFLHGGPLGEQSH